MMIQNQTRSGDSRSPLPIVACLILSVLIGGCSSPQADKGGEKWIQLFNGKNLDGWTPKIAKYDLGVNFGNTFRVEDGVMKMVFDQYKNFDDRYGHEWLGVAVNGPVDDLSRLHVLADMGRYAAVFPVNSFIAVKEEMVLNVSFSQPEAMVFKFLAGLQDKMPG